MPHGNIEQPKPLDVTERWAQVTGAHGRFVLFNFVVADPDLSVDLILPYKAFTEFCATNRAVLTVEPGAAAPFERLKWLSKDADGERTQARNEYTGQKRVSR
ncbi:phenol hydroxylase (plasmid) [Sphingobium sp. SCG-1]|uniref:phenol hydroxylase subunit n=1 Tax=Sphingobium sp. SCG-1 TaxID=2072936 RepID=UPI000CD67566|nr:phenol hydroxylase subunit [Sphingobium sp. SCG-1]AUW60550.1 phenol hydroxylase [Sphingobium sp. SCG-1]